MAGAETCLQSVEPREQDILRLEAELQEFRPLLDNINQVGPQLCQVSLPHKYTNMDIWLLFHNKSYSNYLPLIMPFPYKFTLR